MSHGHRSAAGERGRRQRTLLPQPRDRPLQRLLGAGGCAGRRTPAGAAGAGLRLPARGAGAQRGAAGRVLRERGDQPARQVRVSAQPRQARQQQRDQRADLPAHPSSRRGKRRAGWPGKPISVPSRDEHGVPEDCRRPPLSIGPKHGSGRASLH